MSASALRVLTGSTGIDVAGAGAGPAEYSSREILLRLTAGLAVICGLIHIGAGVDHYGEFPLYALVFSLLATAQIGWAALLVWRATPRWLALGCALQVGIVALWVLSRTTGVPIAPTAWVPEQVGTADIVETFCELVTIVATIGMLAETRHRWARRFIPMLAPVVLGAVLAGAVLGTGAHAG
jgi:hypothetical protein